jgi:UDPglucose--hexose-1-phosphate uridylyltransferase
LSEIRQDPTTKNWVIIASERAKRPHDFARQEDKPEPHAFEPHCPFCPGNETMTPSEVLKYEDSKSQGWRVRAFANRFPALTPRLGAISRKDEGFFFCMDGIGVHEVIVETPLHNQQLALMDTSEICNVLLAYQERYKTLIQLPFVKSVIIFKNHGPMAGTSLEHPHSQLVATPVVPRHFRIRYEVATRYYDDTGRSLYSDLVNHERKTGKRLVIENGYFVAFHPFASHRPFETWIVPKAPRASFKDISLESLRSLANILRLILLKLHRGLNNPDYNYVIDSAPAGDENNNYYLWHIRIIPRIVEVAGFEIGSGIYINPVKPEETARFMRELEVP